MEKIIDVSDNQGVINWIKARADVAFAILRSVRGSGKADYQFSNNVAGCRAAGIGFDVYKYSYGKTEAASITEAQQVVSLLQTHGCGGEVTVWWDMEDKSLRSIGKAQLSKNITAARRVIEAAGYTFGIYCNQDWYSNALDVEAFMDLPWWVARYGINDGEPHTAPDVWTDLWGWQYTSRGKVSGISGYVDMSILYDPGEYRATTAPSLPTIRSGSRGDAVKIIQARLNAAGYNCGAVDGIWGSKTEQLCGHPGSARTGRRRHSSARRPGQRC